jgi:hypothetical protein
MSKYSALFESNSSDLVQSKYDALFEDEIVPTDTESVSKYASLFEDETPTQPQVEQPISPDLKDKLNDTPWYESVLYEINKQKHNAIFGATEGISNIGTDLLNLFGADIENPLAADKQNAFRNLAGAASGVSQEEYEDSTVRDIARVGAQIAPVGAAVSAVSKIPKIAQAVSKVPKAMRLPIGAAITEFIALSGDEQGIADAIADAGYENPLQKKDTDSEFMGRLKNAGEAVALFGGGKIAGKIASKTLVPAVNKTFSGIEKVLEVIDPIIKPIKSAIKQEDKFIAGRMDKFELDNLTMKQNFVDRITPFADQFKKLTKNEQQLFQRLTSNTDTMPEAYKLLDRVQTRKGLDGIKGNFKEVTNSLDELFTIANKNGVEIEYRKDYLPRVMKDYEGFMKSLGKEPKNAMDEMIKEARIAKHSGMSEKMKQSISLEQTNLTSEETAKVIQNFYEGRGVKGGGKAGLQKQRVVDNITTDNQQYYDDFLPGIQRYVDNVVYRTNKNRFVGMSQDPSARNIFQDIETVSKGDTDKATKLAKLISTRFNGGEAKIGKGTNVLRNTIYATTIVNPYSTITQLGDLALNAYRNGVINTISPFGPKIKLKEFGLNDMASEFTDAGAMKGAMDKLFTVTGFKKLDIALKENNIRGAFRQARSELQNKNSKAYKKFIEDNKPFFENETDDLVDAIRRGDSKNENVRHYLFSRLTKTQPITLSEMPAAYLNSKKGRLAYALKTFFVKQLDVIREDIVQKLAKRETTKEGVQNAIRFGMLFGGGTAAINMTKDVMLGRPVEIKDELMDVGMQMIAVSRYAIYKGSSDGLIGLGAAILAPPMPIINEAFKVILAEDKEKALEKQSKELLRYIPIAGKDIYWRLGPGEDKIKKQRLDKLRGKD